MTQEARSLAHDRKKEPSPSGKPGGHSTTGPAFQHYQSAVQLLQHGKFEKAMAAFEKMLPSAPIELLDRCKMYIITCQRQLENHRLTFLTPEENYDYAISKLNTGYYEEAREQFDGILSAHPNADYASTAWRFSTPSPGAPRIASATWPAPSS